MKLSFNRWYLNLCSNSSFSGRLSDYFYQPDRIMAAFAHARFKIIDSISRSDPIIFPSQYISPTISLTIKS